MYQLIFVHVKPITFALVWAHNSSGLHEGGSLHHAMLTLCYIWHLLSIYSHKLAS
jgi:hypothetical protein